MADAYLLEDGSGRYLLEDGSGVLLLEDGIWATDFSEYATGAAPSDWSTNGDADFTSRNIVDDAGSIGGKRMDLVCTAFGERRITWWDDVPLNANTESLCQFEVANAASDFSNQFWARHDGDVSFGETAYMATSRTGTQTRTYKSVGGTFTALGTDDAFSVAADTKYWARFRVNSTTIQFRIWLITDPEPGTWDHSNTDSAVTAAGRAGPGNYQASQTVRVHYWAVGVNGASPPLPSGVVYTETNRDVSVAATVATVDALQAGELARDVSAVATVTVTDSHEHGELGRDVSVAATVAAVDGLKFVETNRDVGIAATVATVDVQRYGETERDVGVVAVIVAVDTYHPAPPPTVVAILDGSYQPVAVLEGSGTY